VEVECRCGGLEFTDIPSNLASDVHRMWVALLSDTWRSIILFMF
jgi:hypothetical protein